MRINKLYLLINFQDKLFLWFKVRNLSRVQFSARKTEVGQRKGRYQNRVPLL